MQWIRRAGLGAALTLAFVAGCMNDISNVAPYAARIGATYKLCYADVYDCELWPPKGPGGDYFILPHVPLADEKRRTGYRLKEGTLLHIEAARRGDKDEDYLLVTLDDPHKPGHRIRASIQPKYLEGWSDEAQPAGPQPPS
jgi:hypothetical protein